MLYEEVTVKNTNLKTLHTAINKCVERIDRVEKCDLSEDSSVGSISAWSQGGPGFKSQQGQEFYNENK